MNQYKNAIIYLAIIVCCLLGFLLFFQTTIDDAFICFRYGYNLIEHSIWNWNTEGEKIEAYTSFTFIILSIIPPLLKVQPQLIFKLVSFIFFLLIIRRLYQSVTDKFFKLIIVLLFVINWQTHIHVYSCLETIFWFWLLIEVIFILHYEDFNRNIQLKLWCFALLLPLTRPEGAIIAMFIFCYIVFVKKDKIYYPALIVFASIGIVYFITRYLYFGYAFPLSFYQKSVGKNLGLLGYVYNSYTALPYIITAVALLFINKKYKLNTYLFLLMLLIFYGLYGSSALFMNYGNRFAYQIFYPVILYSCVLCFNNFESKQFKKIGIAVAFLLILISYKGVFVRNVIEMASIKENALYPYYMQKSHITLGKHIKSINNKNLKVMVGDVGVIPYIGDCFFIDSEGLANVYLSRNHISFKYIQETNPDIMVVITPNNDISMLPKNKKANSMMYQYVQQYSDMYAYKGSLCAKTNSYYLHLFVNNQSQEKVKIEQELQQAIIESDKNQFSITKFLSFDYLLF